MGNIDVQFIEDEMIKTINVIIQNVRTFLTKHGCS